VVIGSRVGREEFKAQFKVLLEKALSLAEFRENLRKAL
jgi:hypothetical protein